MFNSNIYFKFCDLKVLIAEGTVLTRQFTVLAVNDTVLRVFVMKNI